MKTTLHYLFIFLFIAPFYGQTIPSYYNGLDFTKTGDELFLELSTKIKSNNTYVPYTSSETDTWDVLREVDEDPDNALNVLLIYGFNDTDGVSKTDRTRDEDLQDTGGGDTGKWNREHVFAKSLADPRLGTDDPGPGTDVHNLRPADAQQNTSRSNRKFTEGSGDPGIVTADGGWYPGDEWKGDVARVVMYMYLRYNGDGSKISETQCLPIEVGFGEGLAVDENMINLFLKWNVEDPVSAFEDQRNPVIEGIQGNRNPFIDNPYLATLIWGGADVAEDRWELTNPSDKELPTKPTDVVASNIDFISFDLNWTASTDNNVVIDYLVYIDGEYLQTATSTSTTISKLEPSSSYKISIKARDGSNNLSVASDELVVNTTDFSLPADNFKITATGESCPDSKNGIIDIEVIENNTYTTTINGVDYSFNSELIIEGLQPKTYDFCIKIESKNFEQCFSVEIVPGESLLGKATVKANKMSIDISKGTAPYNVFLNGENVYQTNSTLFSIDVSHGDLIEVKTAIVCEGVLSKQIDLFNEVSVYPNPSSRIFEITLPIKKKEVVIELYNIQSQLISSKKYNVLYGKVKLNLDNKPTGIYVAKVQLDKPIVLKLIKN